MKMTTPEILLRCLRDGVSEVVVDPEIAARARRSVEAMISVGTPSMVGE
jgi:quinolinate synthase